MTPMTRAAPVAQRELVGDEPIGNALLGEEKLDDIELRLAGAEDLLVVAAEAFSEAGREELKVVFADDLRLVA